MPEATRVQGRFLIDDLNAPYVIYSGQP